MTNFKTPRKTKRPTVVRVPREVFPRCPNGARTFNEFVNRLTEAGYTVKVTK